MSATRQRQRNLKWIAGMLAAVILTGLPVRRCFAPGADVKDIQDSQQQTSIQLAQLQTQQDAIIQLLEEARVKIDELKEQHQQQLQGGSP
jgi:hypothetical protein